MKAHEKRLLHEVECCEGVDDPSVLVPTADLRAVLDEVARMRAVVRDLNYIAGLRWQAVEALKLTVFVKTSAALNPKRRTRRKS